jgi:AraC-like DNA-binding protein
MTPRHSRTRYPEPYLPPATPARGTMSKAPLRATTPPPTAPPGTNDAANSPDGSLEQGNAPAGLRVMNSVEFRGNPSDLERFAHHVLKQTATMDELSPFEHRMRWDIGGSSGVARAMDLRSGLKLSATKISWERPWAFQLRDAATPLKFMLGRGAAPRMTMSNGRGYAMGGGVLQVRHSRQAISTRCEFVQGGADFEQLALEVDPGRLRTLLGAPVLPQALEKLFTSTGPCEMHEQPMVPALSRLLDEILYADARGASRQLFLEAKGLELLAVLIDELTLASEAMSPLGARDIERLERARRLLLERMDSPPSLPELARSVGVNEFKLKAGFRTLFGDSVFGYLRTQRMDQARRLLVQRDLTVTEVAARVGYANPSKFATAFRKHFGRPPSAMR